MKKILDVAHHRNGVSGSPFYVIRFRDGKQEMIGILFDTSRHVAVFDSKLLAENVIAFAQNSWRGDEYEPFLRDAAAKYHEKLYAATDDMAVLKVMQGGKNVWREPRKATA